MRSIFRGLAAWLGLVAGCAALAATAQDLPTRVGRVAYVEGSVSIYQDPEFGWDQAYVNTPVTSRNSLWTDEGSRAEMRAGGLALRMADLTQLDVSHLDDDGIDAMIQRGALAIRVRHLARGENDVFSTPGAQFRLVADGRYRLDADADGGESRLVVFAGRAVLQGADGEVLVDAGNAIVVADGTYHFERASAGELDRWADARDRAWVERTVTQYVAPDITGYEELDAYGTWINEPGYGALWMPTRVGADWVPYREGHWAWVSPWGWTWIDNEPWGYAPFHYGRWVHVRDRWCWYPGRRIDRQAWAPALVGWIGGSNFSVSVRGSTAPALGWYPLAPQETFHPWYHANSQYVNRVNVIVHTVDDRRRDRDRDARPPREVNRDRGATVVPRDTFLHQRPVSQNVVNVAPQVVRQQPAATQPANLLPSRNDAARDRPASRSPFARDRGGQDQHRAGPAPGGSLAGPSAQGARPPEHPTFARPATPPAPQAAPNAAAPRPAPNAPATNPFARTPERGNRAEREAPHAAPAPQPSATPAAPAANPFARTPERNGRAEHEAPRAAPAPQPSPAPAAPAAANPFARTPAPPQSAPAAPQANERQREQQQREQERAARENQQRAAEQQRQQQQQQQAQQRAAEQQQRAQQQQQERAAREAQQRAAEQQRQQQQQQERATREAQQRAAEQQRQQQQQQQAQQRAAEQQQRAQQQQQERAAREAQQRAAEQQQRAQQQQQERAAREAQQRAAEQQRQQQQQQQAQQRAAEQQQRAQQQQQERAAREAQRPPQAQHPSPPPDKNEKKDDHGSGG